MDDSLMSIGAEDFDDDLICEALESSAKKQPNIDVSSLISEPRLASISKTSSIRLCFDETPKNNNHSSGSKERRRNFARRCLSTDLNNDLSFNSKEQRITFQEFRQTKEIKRSLDTFTIKSGGILSSIENTISPKASGKNLDNSNLNLTPEFNKKPKIDENKAKHFKSSNDSGGVVLQKCFSENHASIMRAVQISSTDPLLIGDFSKAHILPLLTTDFKHRDLKSISCHVLVDILNGRYADLIESFTIIDCRYPYEFKGGHIKTAINLYTQEHILTHFMKNKTKEADSLDSNHKRQILIFHCEFSSERGPSLCRFLRNKDRVKNSRVYPNLYYPELYLLEGGYKEFYNNYSDHCEPRSYLPMHSTGYEEDLRKFRAITKSFDSKFSTMKRNLRL